MRHLIERLGKISEAQRGKEPVAISGNDIGKILRQAEPTIDKILPSGWSVHSSDPGEARRSKGIEYEVGPDAEVHMDLMVYREYDKPIAVDYDGFHEPNYEGESDIGLSITVEDGKFVGYIHFESAYPTKDGDREIAKYTDYKDGEAKVKIGNRPTDYKKNILNALKKAIAKAKFPKWETFEPDEKEPDNDWGK